MENPTVYKPSAQAFVRSARNQRVMIRSPTEQPQGRGSAGRECRGAAPGLEGKPLFRNELVSRPTLFSDLGPEAHGIFSGRRGDCACLTGKVGLVTCKGVQVESSSQI